MMTTTLPLFPLSSPLFPGMVMPLRLFEERYLRLFSEHADQDPIFGVVLTKTGREVDDQAETHAIGTAARLLALFSQSATTVEIAIIGSRRFRIHSSDWSRTFLVGEVEWLQEPDDLLSDLGVLADRAAVAYRSFVRLVAAALTVELADDPLPTTPTELSYALAHRLPCNTWEQQQLLVQPTPLGRLRQIIAIIERERALLERQGATGPAIEPPGQRFLLN